MPESYGFRPRTGGEDKKPATTHKSFAKAKPKVFEPSGHKCYSIFLDKECPEYVIEDILESGIIMHLEKNGYRLRIGVPEKDGVDTSKIVQETLRRQFIIPWKGFNDIPEEDVYSCTTDEAKSLYAKNIMSDIPDNIMPIAAVKVNLLLGRSCKNASKFCVLWTPDGAENVKELTRETGYLATVIRLCNKFEIPVHNLSKASTWDLLLEMQ